MVNRDDVIRMALEAGAKPSHNPERWDIWNIRDTDLERFAKLVSEREREECAKVCEAQRSVVVARHPARFEFDPNCVMAQKCAAFIRARGEK